MRIVYKITLVNAGVCSPVAGRHYQVVLEHAEMNFKAIAVARFTVVGRSDNVPLYDFAMTLMKIKTGASNLQGAKMYGAFGEPLGFGGVSFHSDDVDPIRKRLFSYLAPAVA